jgi:uncharacterized membrane protein (Fun14 family)
MKRLNSMESITLIFFAATALLVFYLLSISWHVYLSVSLFWVAIALMLGTITYQILKAEMHSSNITLLLLEIGVTCFVFHLIYVIPYYGLAGYDPYFDMVSTKGILSSGFILGDPKYFNLTSDFPMIHVLGAVLSMITGIGLFSVAKWFSSLVGVAVIPLLYLLVRGIFKEEKVALLSALLFACVQNQIYFSSQFIRETFALVLAVCCLYLYFSAEHSPHPAANYALSVICLIGTVFAHHLTSFMLLVFLSVHFLVTKASEVPYLRRTYFGPKIMGEKVKVTFVLIAFAALFAYWIFVVDLPLNSLVNMAQNLFSPSQYGVRTYANLANISTSSLRSIRQYVEFYGFYSFLFIFALVLLYKLLPRTKNRRVETYSFTLFLLLCLLIGFLSLYVIAPEAYPDRFLTYGWLFGFAPLAVAILKGKYKWLRIIGVLLLVAFMLFNIYLIDPAYWDARNAQATPHAPTLEEYTLANTIDFSTGKILASDQNTVGAIYDVYNNLGTIVTYSEEVNLTQFNWIVIQKQELQFEKSYYSKPQETITILENLTFGSSPGYNKIYESDNLVVITHVGS